MTHENQFTPRAEEALRLAQEAAEEMGHGYVGCEHILLGLMREEDGIAHRVMQEYGMTEDMICTVLERSVGKGLSGAAPSQGLTPRAKSAVELAVSEAMRMGAGYADWKPESSSGAACVRASAHGPAAGRQQHGHPGAGHRGHRPQEDVQLRGAENQ